MARGRPPIKPTSRKSSVIRVRIKDEDVKRIDAERGDVPRSEWIRAAILDKLGKIGKMGKDSEAWS